MEEGRSTGLFKIMLTLMDYFSPADRRTPWVTDGYCCSLVIVCETRRRTGWDRPVNHLSHIMYVLRINALYNLSVNIITTNSVYGQSFITREVCGGVGLPPLPIYSPWKKARCPLNRGLGGPQRRCWCFEKR